MQNELKHVALHSFIVVQEIQEVGLQSQRQYVYTILHEATSKKIWKAYYMGEKLNVQDINGETEVSKEQTTTLPTKRKWW